MQYWSLKCPLTLALGHRAIITSIPECVCISLSRPETDWPFYVDWPIKLEQDEVSCLRSNGPEEVFPHVGLLKCMTLIHFKRGGHLCRRVHVNLMQQRFQEVFILTQQKTKLKGSAADDWFTV